MRKPTEAEIRAYSLENYRYHPGMENHMPAEPRNENWILWYLLVLAIIAGVVVALVNT